MAVHLVALAALHMAHGGGPATQLVTSLVWPYLLRVCLTLKFTQDEVVTSSRLFMFQLLHIISTTHDHDHEHGSGNQTAQSDSRWHRAVRLIRERSMALFRGSIQLSVPLSPHQQHALQLFSALSL